MHRSALRFCLAGAVRPAARRFVPVARTVPQRGLFDGIKGRLQQRADDKLKTKQEDEFRKSLDDMLKHETYTLEHHKRIVDEAVEKGSGFRGWVARQTEQASQMEALTKVQSLLSAMTPDELSQGPAVIKRREKLRLSEASSMPVPDINVFFKQFEMTKAFHAWIRYRHKNNLPLPTSMDEAHVMLKESPAGFPRVDLGNTPRSLRRRVR